jgi:oligopeptide transport system substrate-binding protein
MKKAKRIPALVAGATALGLIASGCGSSGGDEGGDSDAPITARSIEPQNPIIPTSTNEVGGGNIVDELWAGLVSYSPEGETQMEVAESIESEDNVNWTVKLEDGWEFSDGTPVTADSFVDAWNYGADPENAQLGAYFFEPIKGTTDDGTFKKGADGISGLEVKDDSTFTIELKSPASDFADRLGYSSYFPLPESAFEDMEAFGEKPIGNGPYTLESWDHDVEAQLKTNPDYDGNRKPKNGGITFKFYTDPEAAYTDVQSGVLNVSDEIPPSALSTFEEDESIQAINKPGPINTTVTIPDSLEHFGDDKEGKLRRQAISRAIDRKTITEQIFEGTHEPAVDFSSPAMPDASEDVPGNEVLEFDPDEAKKLWAEADKINKFEGKFELGFNADGAGNTEWVEAVTNQVRKNLDIKAEPKPIATFAEFRELITSRKIDSAFRTGWQPDYPSAFSYLASVFGTGAGSNDGDYSNKKFDDAIREAAAAEGKKRNEGMTKAQAVLFEDLPAIPLWTRNSYGAASADTSGFEFTWQNKPAYHLIVKN